MRKITVMICLISFILVLVLIIPVQARDNWKVLCDNRTGEITLTRDMPPPQQIVLKQYFPSEQAARQWVNVHYPNWRCQKVKRSSGLSPGGGLLDVKPE